MLGFGELVANEAAFRLGWGGTKVRLTIARVRDGEGGMEGDIGKGGDLGKEEDDKANDV